MGLWLAIFGVFSGALMDGVCVAPGVGWLWSCSSFGSVGCFLRFGSPWLVLHCQSFLHGLVWALVA
ncbi:hypothetical protein [Escherichia coli]|uniref:hypothetical protein n=1 Tax=Escherichia coli TaxID=562 RepID=UPI0011E9485A|nr:hypothetical protein [Escherichia coli]